MTCFNSEQLEIFKAFDVDAPTECLLGAVKEVLRKKCTPKKARNPKSSEAKQNSAIIEPSFFYEIGILIIFLQNRKK